MKKKLIRLYRSVVPPKIRKNCWEQVEKFQLAALRKKILAYYGSRPGEVDFEKQEVINYLRKNRLTVFPYEFYDQYDSMQVTVHRDTQTGMPYVLHTGKKLYLKRSWSDAEIRKYYISLLAEQDPRSPHRYLTQDFDLAAGDVIADIGCAEGNFSLEAVDKVRAIYLFEVDAEWIEALNETFRPWQDKVHIINKFVSDKDDANNIMLDSIFSNGKEVSFIKIDAEGSERPILAGAAAVIRQPHLKLVICTYHQQQDEQDFILFLQERQFKVQLSSGYMIFHYDKKIAPPYLRRGLLRAVKS